MNKCNHPAARGQHPSTGGEWGKRKAKFPSYGGVARNAGVVFLLAALIFLTGCDKNFLPTRGEITSFEIIRVLGIDKSADSPSDIEVTLIAERAKPSPGEESAGVSYKVMSASGATAFEAVSKLRSVTDKKQVMGYVDYILIGESAARDDLGKYVDYPARNPEIRYSPKIFIVKGATAKQLMADGSSEDNLIEENLDNLSASAEVRSDFSFLKNIDLMNLLDRSDVAAVIPAIAPREPKNEKLIGGEPPERSPAPAGYAVVRDAHLVGFLEGGSARGYNFMTGKVRTCDYSVLDNSGESIALHIVSDGMKLKKEFDGDMPRCVTYTFRVSAGIAEQHSRARLTDSKALSALEAALSEKIRADIESAVEISREYGIDCFDLGGRIRIAHPYKWQRIKDDWREIYKNLEIRIEAETSIRRVYDLREPSGVTHEGGDRK